MIRSRSLEPSAAALTTLTMLATFTAGTPSPLIAQDEPAPKKVEAELPPPPALGG